MAYARNKHYIKRRPPLTPLVVKGLPQAVGMSQQSLPVDKSRDTPRDKELRAALEYILGLHYWYREQTMNYQYNLTEGRRASKRHAYQASLSSHPTPYGP